MTTSVEYRSVFELGPNDEILVELVSANSALQTPCNQATVPAGLCVCFCFGFFVILYMFWNGDHLVIHICLTCPNITFTTALVDLNQERQWDSSLVREVSDKMVCLACRCTFTNREDQVYSRLCFKLISKCTGFGTAMWVLIIFFGMLDGTLQAGLASFQFETKDVGSIASLNRRV